MKHCDEKQVDKFNKNSAVSDTVTAEVEITHTETETGEVARSYQPLLCFQAHGHH